MTKKPRSSRRAPAPPAPAPASGGDRRSRWLLGAVAVVIVGAAALAIVLGDGLSGASSSPAVSTSPGVAAGSSAPGASAAPVASGASTVPPPAASATSDASVGTGGTPVITGSPLPPFPASGDDPARGLAAPTVQGASFDGTPMAIEPSGRPTAVLFLAHWCQHCQREVPLVQSWIDANGMPQGVDILSVATGIDPAAPNYPPEAWLAREGWTVPVIVDPTNSLTEAYGLSGYPFWVFLDGGGKVVQRAVGELTIAQLTTILTTLKGT